jgi:hypothetical protein
MDVTGRNDWSSTLPENNNSYFYPSVSAGLIFSELVEVPGLEYGKLRTGWAQVGNDADPVSSCSTRTSPTRRSTACPATRRATGCATST